MTEQDKNKPTTEFESQGKESRNGILSEFWNFLKHNKKWWLLPIILVLLGLGLIIILGGNAALAPFIYPLF